jgi:hypothetical protein
MCIQCEENEQKRQIIGIFRSPRGITVKNGSIVPKTELGLDILMKNLKVNFISVCASSAKKMNGNCVDRLTDSSKAICPPFFEGGHKKIKLSLLIGKMRISVLFNTDHILPIHIRVLVS